MDAFLRYHCCEWPSVAVSGTTHQAAIAFMVVIGWRTVGHLAATVETLEKPREIEYGYFVFVRGHRLIVMRNLCASRLVVAAVGRYIIDA